LTQQYPLSATDLEALHNQGIQYFNQKWEEGTENERYKKIKNWSPDKERKIRSQGRLPYSIPIAVTKMNTILATQKQARTQFKVVAKVDPNDEIKAELATLMLRDDEKSSKFKYLESEVFDSGMSVKYSAAEAYVDYSTFQPKIKFRKLDYKNVVWDTNSREYDVNEDGLFVAKVDRVYRFQLRQEFPEYADKLNHNTNHIGRDKDAYYVVRNPNGKNDFDIIAKFTHYQKVSRKCWYVIHPDPMNILSEGVYTKKFKTQEEAEMHLREINIPYLSQGLDFDGTVETKDEIKWDKYVFADTLILSYEETDYPSSPIKVYRCFHFEDDFWSFMDVLKSPQIFYDRLLAQIDYSFGSDIKNVYQLNVNALADIHTPEKAKHIIEQTGGVVFSNSSEEILRAVKSQGLNPQWIQIATVMQGLMEDFGGGRSFSGLGDESGESGRAINLKKQQGALVAFLMLDNLSRWKQSLGEFALYLHKEFDTAERQMKVQGAELTPEMIQMLNQNGVITPSQSDPDSMFVKVGGIDFLKDADLELTVTEAALTESEKEFKYMQLLEMGRSNPTLWQMPAYTMMLLDYNTDVPERTKKQLIQQIQEFNKAQAQAEQEERNIKKAEVLQQGVTAQLQLKQGIANANRARAN
jgi:hypothetical protein